MWVPSAVLCGYSVAGVGSTPVGTQYHIVLQVLLHSYLCCRFHSYLLPPQVPLLFAAAGSTPICLQPPTCAESFNTHLEPNNTYIHTYIQCSAAQYNIPQYTIQTIPHTICTVLLLSYSLAATCTQHLITSYLQVTPHQQHMCVRMPPIGIHWHVHITTAHSNSTYTSPPPNTNTCTTLAASRDILSMHPCWHTCP